MNKLLLFSAVMLLGLSLVACSSKDSENIETLQQEVESLKPIVTATPTPAPTPTTAPTAIPINRESRQSLEAPTVEPKEPPKRRSDYEISEVANLTQLRASPSPRPIAIKPLERILLKAETEVRLIKPPMVSINK